MKTKFTLLASLLASAAVAFGAPLTGTTAVHTQPDASAPSITFLKAGSEPVPATDAPATIPPGWMAVELPGPHEGYVPNKDIQKSLDVRIGAAIRLLPKTDAGVLTTMEAADKAEITGLRGKWTQVRVEKSITGYIQIGTTNTKPVAATSKPAPATPAPMSPAPVAPMVYGVTTAGKAAPISLNNADGTTLPRNFAGKFVSTRSPFKPRRPYDWALNDDAGKRFAYLDISKLLLTEQIESYLDHAVVVFGAARPTEDRKDLVIEVESLQLK